MHVLACICVCVGVITRSEVIMLQSTWTFHLSPSSQLVQLGLGFGHGNNKQH